MAGRWLCSVLGKGKLLAVHRPSTQRRARKKSLKASLPEGRKETLGEAFAENGPDQAPLMG